MKFLVITHVLHKEMNGSIYGYGPYIKEMNLWLNHVDEVRIVGPLSKEAEVSPIDLPYEHRKFIFDVVPLFSLVSKKEKFLTLIKLPYMLFTIFKAMLWADHIHLRCPGNMGLLGAMVQIFFPHKTKTAKYAGNWDPESAQPWSYRLQKAILSNTFLSKNMRVLVYGEWQNQTRNILPFFTASYLKNEMIPIESRALNQTIKLLFVGSLSYGKRPLLAMQVVQRLVDENIDVHLDVLGDGPLRTALEDYIKDNNLEKYVTLHGNQNADYVKSFYQKSHFLILMSQSEGWPKVVAEAMFWGCVPISTNVSCINYMIGNGQRGKIALVDPDDIASKIMAYLSAPSEYRSASMEGITWAREFTLESFEDAIQKVLS